MISSKSTITVASLLASVLACACAENSESTASSLVTTRDSAGVQIVLNGADVDSAVVLSDPSLRIGTAMGDSNYEFHDIGPIMVANAGEIFVANGGSMSIRVFNTQGGFVREFGRRGQGPAEFRSISSLIVAGDSVIVVDHSARRASVFLHDGHFVDSWDLRLDGSQRAEPVALTPQGVLALVRGPSRHFTAEPFGIIQDTIAIALFDPISRQAGPVIRHWTGERRIAGTEVYPVHPLFEPRNLFAVRPDGVQYLAFAGMYVIDMFDASGAHIRQIRRDVPPTAATTEHVDGLLAALGNQQRGSEQRTAVERSARYPLPSHLETLGAIIVAPSGAFIVQRLDELDPVKLEHGAQFRAEERSNFASASSAVRWDRFDRDGRYVGAIRLPRRYFPRFYDGDTVLGVLEDDDRVEYLVGFQLAGTH